MLRLHHQETPSRILRRIKEAENDSDMPSLPSMASMDGSDDGSEDIDESAVKPKRSTRADTTVGSSSSSAGRRGSRKQPKSHQNTTTTNNHNNSAIGRNILSPLKLNGRNSPITQSPATDAVDLKGKGKAGSYSNSKSNSPGPLSAVSSNRTVRPASQSPHDFRGTSVTPSIHVTSRANKPSRRTQAISFDESLPQADHSSAQHHPDETQDEREPTQSLNLDFTEDSGFPERPQLETSLWSRRSEGNSSRPPTPLKQSPLSGNNSVDPDITEDRGVTLDNVSLPPQPTPERHQDTYDYTTASPTAANGFTRPQDFSERRGSTSSSASGSTSEIPQIQVTPAPAPMVRARRVLIRSASIDQSAEDSIGTTPGIGRRLPSAERRNDNSPSYIIDTKLVEGDTEAIDGTTPSRSSSTTPTSSMPVTAPSTALTSRGYSYTNTPDALATPKATTTDADLERRKMHLLSTLRMTALKSTKKGTRLARGTPHPRDRRARSLTPGASGADDSTAELDASTKNDASGDDMTAMSGSSTMSDGSSNDLTTHPRGHGNTSLPLAGPGMAAEGGIVGASRFNNAKLNNYLHTLNTHLTTENQNLIKTLEETAKEVSRLMRKNEELSRLDGSQEVSAGVSGRSMSRIAEDDEGDATREMLQSHRKTSQDITTLREHLTGSSAANPSAQLLEEMREKDARLEKLQADLQQRDAEIAAMRADVLRQSKSSRADDSSEGDRDPDLQQQIFDLRDELSRVKAENTVQSGNLAKVRAEQLEQSSRHNKVIADLQARSEDLLLELEEKDAIIEEIENELVKQEEDFRSKMSSLEAELCKVMEEQEVQLRDARKEILSLKTAQGPVDDSVVQDLRSKVSALETERDELKAARTRAESMLQEATETIANKADSSEKSISGASSEEMAFMRKRLQDLEITLAEKERQLSELQDESSRAQRQYEAEAQNLRNEVGQAESASTQLERKLSSQAVILKETEKALADAEDNLRQTAEEQNEARRQLHELRDEISNLRNQQMEILSSDLQIKYDSAMREIGNLKHQLAYPPVSTTDVPAGKYSKHDSRDLEIKTLRSSNHELETRVNQLRKQSMLAGQSPNNSRSSSSAGTPGRAEKSVRFDSVRSMKTPRTASQLLGGGMSWLDKTGNSSAANATASPLYAEIDILNRDIEQYKHLLQSANDEIDDKLRKLDGAGSNVISMAKELEHARRKIRDLESGSSAVSSNSTIVQELRAVRDELTSERSSLMRRLKDIQDQCRQMALQLDTSRSAQSEMQRKLDWQTSQLHRVQGRGAADTYEQVELCMDPTHREMAAERDAIVAGVAALKRDLTKVQQDALDLGHDLQAARNCGTVRLTSDVASTSSCNKASCVAAQARSKQEAKGLLLMISHLKAKFTRESYFRADLAHQKLYLSLLIDQKQKIVDATNVTLDRFGLPPPQQSPKPPMSLKIAAQAVIATIRMQKLSTEWSKQSAVKAALRDAYKHTRGKPFPLTQ